MNLVEEIKASLLALKKDYPYGILDDQVMIAFNYQEDEADLEFLNSVITKGFKISPEQYCFNGKSEIVINFGSANKFKGDTYTLNVKTLKEISADPKLKKELWIEIQQILKML